MNSITYLIYIIFWEALVLGLPLYYILEKGHSAWWLFFAIFLSAASFQPRAWIHGEKNE